jgi:hypothetical protein
MGNRFMGRNVIHFANPKREAKIVSLFSGKPPLPAKPTRQGQNSRNDLGQAEEVFHLDCVQLATPSALRLENQRQEKKTRKPPARMPLQFISSSDSLLEF